MNAKNATVRSLRRIRPSLTCYSHTIGAIQQQFFDLGLVVHRHGRRHGGWWREDQYLRRRMCVVCFLSILFWSQKDVVLTGMFLSSVLLSDTKHHACGVMGKRVTGVPLVSFFEWFYRVANSHEVQCHSKRASSRSTWSISCFAFLFGVPSWQMWALWLCVFMRHLCLFLHKGRELLLWFAGAWTRCCSKRYRKKCNIPTSCKASRRRAFQIPQSKGELYRRRTSRVFGKLKNIIQRTMSFAHGDMHWRVLVAPVQGSYLPAGTGRIPPNDGSELFHVQGHSKGWIRTWSISAMHMLSSSQANWVIYRAPKQNWTCTRVTSIIYLKNKFACERFKIHPERPHYCIA